MRMQPRQMTVFDSDLRERFASRVAQMLRTDHPGDVEMYDDDELLDLVNQGLDRAKAYGLTTDEDNETFVSLLFTVGWYCDRHPEFHRYLTDEAIEPGDRMRYLLEGTDDNDWEEAAAISDEELAKERVREP